MSKNSKLPTDINDVPVIFIRDIACGTIQEKISINELKRRNQQNPEDQLIKMYRAALDHYANQNYELAEILLIRLIECCEPDAIHYEYYERLANLYRTQEQYQASIDILTEAVAKLQLIQAPESLIQRAQQRLNKAYRQESPPTLKPLLKTDPCS